MDYQYLDNHFKYEVKRTSTLGSMLTILTKTEKVGNLEKRVITSPGLKNPIIVGIYRYFLDNSDCFANKPRVNIV